MSASAIAIGSNTLKKFRKPERDPKITKRIVTISLQNHHKRSSPPLQLPLLEKESFSLLRREAIGLSFCLGLINGFFTQQPEAVSAEEVECKLNVTPSGIEFCDRVVGNGLEATKGQLIKAHYIGKLENGKIFDSSYNRGKPLAFRVGVGEVIKGWDLGILGADGIPPMLAGARKGGKRTLKLPPNLGYGMRGAGCKGGSCIIPPDSVLLFDVEFIGKA